MKLKRLIAILVVAVTHIIVLGVFLFDKRGAAGGPDNIFLISIDTIRADHLSCYGYQHKTTPVIDAFAEGAVLFENCFANIPLTLPSHATMLTGLIPPTHGVQDNFDMALSESISTLPEMLGAQGYRTYGIISAEVLNRHYGLDQGFDVYDDTFDSEDSRNQLVAQRMADETVSHALEWLEENQDKKKFMFIHFYDPHFDYIPPAPYDKQFQRPYDGEIAFVDNCIGRFIDRLKGLGLYDDSLIVIVGDHAELLGEHGEPEHGYFIYQNVLRVPLIIKPAGHSKQMRVADNTSLADITPTVLGQSGIKVPKIMQGVDLSDYLVRENHHIGGRFIFNECLTATKYKGNSLLGVINDQWHYIQTTRPELYNLIDDPGEFNNLIKQEPKRGRFLQSKLNKILDAAISAGTQSDIALNYESRQALKSLGYVGGAINTDVAFDKKREDPKDLVRIHNRLQKVMVLTHDEKFDEAITLCNQVLQERPDIAPTYETLADIYIRLEEYDKAIELTKKKLALLKDDIGTLKYLAETYNLAEDYPQAIHYINVILGINAEDTSALGKLASIYIKLEEYDKAIEVMEKKLVLLPDDMDTLKFLAETYNLAGDYQQAVNAINNILKLEGDAAGTYFYLAKNYQRLKDSPKVLENCLKALELDSDYLSARISAADAYKKMGRLKEAVEYYETAFEQDSNLPIRRNSVAWIRATQKDPELYNPVSALVHAQKAVALSKDKLSSAHGYYPYILDTLAVAQSANGQFEAAVETAELAIKLCREKGLDALGDDIQTRLELYKQHKAYRE
jgi:arylsulfatase A-like enzyme/cytochrome c-type biogenesis protein CcmH/NrfG